MARDGSASLLVDCDNLPHTNADSLPIDSVQNGDSPPRRHAAAQKRMTRSLAATVGAAALILSIGVGLRQRTVQAAFTERRATVARERAIFSATGRAAVPATAHAGTAA